MMDDAPIISGTGAYSSRLLAYVDHYISEIFLILLLKMVRLIEPTAGCIQCMTHGFL